MDVRLTPCDSASRTAIVQSDCSVYMPAPSPQSAMTLRSGAATAAPTASGMPCPIAPPVWKSQSCGAAAMVLVVMFAINRGLPPASASASIAGGNNTTFTATPSVPEGAGERFERPTGAPDPVGAGSYPALECSSLRGEPLRVHPCVGAGSYPALELPRPFALLDISF